VGGWIINAEGLRFCHEGDGDCFDRYHQDSIKRREAKKKKEISYKTNY
jgi:L-ascorbate metabolism protein UlaG (beta-lactamase superfamily)